MRAGGSQIGLIILDMLDDFVGGKLANCHQTDRQTDRRARTGSSPAAGRAGPHRVSVIETRTTLVRGQELPVFCPPALPQLLLAPQTAARSTVEGVLIYSTGFFVRRKHWRG